MADENEVFDGDDCFLCKIACTDDLEPGEKPYFFEMHKYKYIKDNRYGYLNDGDLYTAMDLNPCGTFSSKEIRNLKYHCVCSVGRYAELFDICDEYFDCRSPEQIFLYKEK